MNCELLEIRFSVLEARDSEAPVARSVVVAALASRKLRIGIVGSASVFSAAPNRLSNSWTTNDVPITNVFEMPNNLRFVWDPYNKAETNRASMVKENAASIQNAIESPNKKWK